MNLYMKQKVFSWGDKFTVFDEESQPKYLVKGEVFSLGKKLHIYDTAENELGFIHQKLLALMPRYFFEQNGTQVAEVNKKIALFRQKYIITPQGWEVDGNFFEHDYTISANGQNIATIKKEWFTFGDAYHINISDDVDELTVLAVVLIIDACNESNNTSSANN